MALPITFGGWQLQQSAQRRASRRSEMGRLRAGLAHVHAIAARALASGDDEELSAFAAGTLQGVMDTGTALHTFFSRRQLDMLRERIIALEANLGSLRNAAAGARAPDDGVRAERLRKALELVQASRSLIGDRRPLLDDRTLAAATTWRTWALAVAQGLAPFAAFFVVLAPFHAHYGYSVVGGGAGLALLVRRGAFRPQALRERLERAQDWAFWGACIMALFAVVVVVAIGWMLSLIANVANARGANVVVVQVFAVLYGAAFVCAFGWLMRYCLRRRAQARTAADIATATGNDGVCKLESHLPDVTLARPCACTGFTCLREAGGIGWVTLQM